MGSLYERIKILCDEKDITGYRLCKDTGLTPSVLTDLKMGRKKDLSTKNINKIAEYFGVSADYLLGNVSEPYFYLDNERIKAELNSYGDEDEKTPTASGRRQVSREDIVFALSRGREEVISDEMFEEVQNFYDYLVQREEKKKNQDT